MGAGKTEKFRKDAARIALMGGLAWRQVADDWGLGLSTLNTWVNAQRPRHVVSPKDRNLAPENRIPKGPRDISKKPPSSSRTKGHAVSVEDQHGAFPIERLRQLVNVSWRRLRARRENPETARADQTQSYAHPTLAPPNRKRIRHPAYLHWLERSRHHREDIQNCRAFSDSKRGVFTQTATQIRG